MLKILLKDVLMRGGKFQLKIQEVISTTLNLNTLRFVSRLDLLILPILQGLYLYD